MSLLLVLGGLLTGCASIKPVTSVQSSCPDILEPNESGTFTATVNDDATQPLEVRWDFGDGNTAPGMTATHSFAGTGRYTVTFTASNRKSTDSATCAVEVLAPPACEITAQPRKVDVCQQPLPPIRFRASVTGSAPDSYAWDFGDGESSTLPEVSYTYERSDTFSATLTRRVALDVTNAAGTSQCTTFIDIEPCPCNPDFVFAQTCFDRGEGAMLGDQARRNMQDNLQVLRENPRFFVAVMGFAQANERRAQGLADERAQAVARYYTDNGIDPDRVRAVGMVSAERNKRGPVCTQTVTFCSEASRNAYVDAQ